MENEKYIIKRNGTREVFKTDKIRKALHKTNMTIAEDKVDPDEIDRIVDKVYKRIIKNLNRNGKDSINMVSFERILLKNLERYPSLKTSYKTYNLIRERSRLINTGVFKSIGDIAKETDRDNANVGNNFSSKLLRIASEANKYYNLAKIDKKIARNHETGRIYQHDLDAYNLTANCLHIDAGKVLGGGFNTGYGTLNEPKRITSAAALMCIIIQSSQNDMYGGQSIPNFDTDLAIYLRKTLKEECREHAVYISEENSEIIAERYYNKIREAHYVPWDKESRIIIKRVSKELKQAMSTVVCNLNTMHSRAGSQVPFSSLNIGIINDVESALICERFLLEYEKGLGKGEQPIFPNIIFRVKSGLNKNPEDRYYYLYRLACRVAAKRMNPTFMNMDSSFNIPHYKKGNIPATMGCRTYIMDNINGESVVEGRGNAASATINLPRIAMEVVGSHPKSNKEELKLLFNDALLKEIEAAKDSLLSRYKEMIKLKVKDLPFSAGEGLLMGSEGLTVNDSIEGILKHSSWAIGFIGLAEALIIILGEHHGQSKDAREYGFNMIKTIRDKADEYKQEYRLNFSCYATPAEGLSGYFISKDAEIFGIIPGITDKGYYTNSFHIPVDFKISYRNKINIEAPYHALCNGGHISYVEVDGTPTEEVIEKIITNAFTTTDMSYMGINFHIKYCKNCGHYLEDEAINKCDKCGSNDIQGISRVTGYLGLDERFGYGKSNEREVRTAHSDNMGIVTEESLGKQVYNIKK